MVAVVINMSTYAFFFAYYQLSLYIPVQLLYLVKVNLSSSHSLEYEKRIAEKRQETNSLSSTTL